MDSDQANLSKVSPDMPESTYPDLALPACTEGWCALTDAMLAEDGIHAETVVRIKERAAAGRDHRSGPGRVPAVWGRGRFQGSPVLLHDLPRLGASMYMYLLWRKRIYRGREDNCEVMSFSEVHELASPRAKRIRGAIAWAVDRLRSHDVADLALAKVLGVDGRTLWDAAKQLIADTVERPARLTRLNALEVDEHV